MLNIEFKYFNFTQFQSSDCREHLHALKQNSTSLAWKFTKTNIMTKECMSQCYLSPIEQKYKNIVVALPELYNEYNMVTLL